MTFVFDENTSEPLIVFMRRIGATNIHHITEYLPVGTLDPDILPYVAKRNMILVTCDKAMRKAHKDILEKHRVKVLFLPKAYAEKWTIWEQATFMFRYWRNIAEAAEHLRHLSVKLVSETGKLNDI